MCIFYVTDMTEMTDLHVDPPDPVRRHQCPDVLLEASLTRRELTRLETTSHRLRLTLYKGLFETMWR